MRVDQARYQGATAAIKHRHIVRLEDGQGFVRDRFDQFVLDQNLHALTQPVGLAVEDTDVADQRQPRQRRLVRECKLRQTVRQRHCRDQRSRRLMQRLLCSQYLRSARHPPAPVHDLGWVFSPGQLLAHQGRVAEPQVGDVTEIAETLS